MDGYAGKILEVNLSNNGIKNNNLSKEDVKSFLGGAGLGAKIFFDRELWKVEPLSGENLLIFTVGPLTGTLLPGVSRFEVCTKSPLTGNWGEASCGAHFGARMKNAGYDGFIIGGKAKEPVYILINEDKVEILPANDLWGKDTYQTEEILKGIHSKRAQVACIGPAGENLVLFAGIVNDNGDVAARCGVGAVMGSKNLKAIVILGNKKVSIADEEKFKEVRKRMWDKASEHPFKYALNEYGTNSGMLLGTQIGDVPVKYWRIGTWTEGVEKIDGAAVTENILVGKGACFSCPVACKRIVEVKEGKYQVKKGPGPEYESAAAFGSLLMNDNLNVIAKANEICNQMGMDTISCGSVIGWAFECYEKGIINKKDTDGLELEWGNVDAVLELLSKIAKREGIGNILADGVKKASEKIKKGSEKFALTIKNLEVPMHDPRAYHGMSLGYTTGVRGSCHTSDLNLMIEMGISSYPEVGIKGKYKPLSSERKAEMTVASQNIAGLYSSLVMCYFLASMFSVADMAEMVNAVCGYNLTPQELLKIGERNWYLRRCLNYLCGFTAKDDDLPERIKAPFLESTTAGLEMFVHNATAAKAPTNPKLRKLFNNFTYNVLFPKMGSIVKTLNSVNVLGKSSAQRHPERVVPKFKKMKKEYYELRDLDNVSGKPSKEILEDLGLQDVAKAMK